MLLLQIEITPIQAGLIFGAALGFVLGLIPLIIGIVKKQPKLGVLGLIGAIIGNTILGLLLSIPIIGICIYLILKKQPAEAGFEPKMSDRD